VHEHRNYIPSLGIISIFVLALNILTNKVKLLNSNIILFLVALGFSTITVSRAHDWSDIALLGERLVQRHPESATANYEMGYIYSKIYLQTGDSSFGYIAQKALRKANSLSSSNLQPAIALAHISALLDEVEDNKLIDKIVRGFRHGKITNTELIELRQFILCQIQGACNSSISTIKTVFNALLTNPELKGRLRDDALYIYCSYLVTIPDGAEQALSIMKDVASRNKDILEYQVQLISILLTNEKNDEAHVLMGKLTDQYGIKWDVIKN
jgi:hypothetical protein